MVDAIKRALGGEGRRSDLLQMITAARGAINGLMPEVLKDHVREYLAFVRPGKGRAVSCAYTPGNLCPHSLREPPLLYVLASLAPLTTKSTSRRPPPASSIDRGKPFAGMLPNNTSLAAATGGTVGRTYRTVGVRPVHPLRRF